MTKGWHASSVQFPHSERSKPESWLTLLWLWMVAIAVVALFVCAAALLATIEFAYRRLIAPPIGWLLSRPVFAARHGKPSVSRSTASRA